MKALNKMPNLKNNPPLLSYLDMYNQIEQQTKDQIETFGLAFQKENKLAENGKRLQSLKESDAVFRNNDKSILSNGKISSACEACQTGTGSYTSFVSLKCHRDCYFCFNKNQSDYQFYLQNQKNVNVELETLYESGAKLTHVALTGGEPLLHPEETVAFFQLAKKLDPSIHTRLYTAGDLLTEDLLQELKEAGLREIRFSIKMEDSAAKQKHILKQINLANQYIEDVLVEMPVIPGTGEEMKRLLLALDELEIFGVNLLEFCFPLENPEAFKEKGFTLKNPPYDIYYNFWYAGGLAVDESERLCLELVDFAIENKLDLGVHYCSLENKFTGQIYQQNHDQKLDKTYTFSERDYYFKTAKVFGEDKAEVKRILNKNKITYIENEDFDFLQFTVRAIPRLKNRDVDLLISSNVVEEEGGEIAIREVDVEAISVKGFKLSDI